MKKTRDRRIRAVLRRRRKTLSHLRRVEKDRMRELLNHREADALDQAAVDVDLETMDLVKEMEYRRLVEVTRSLERLGAGQHTCCICCRRVIDSQRLDAVPETMLCIRCAEVAEQSGRFDTAPDGLPKLLGLHIGRRPSVTVQPKESGDAVE